MIRTAAFLLFPLFLLAADVNLNMFGTLGVSVTPSDDVEFNAYGGQRDGSTGGEPDLMTNTILGAQGDVFLTEELSLTAQGIARKWGESLLKK